MRWRCSIHLLNRQSKCAYVKECNLASHYEANCGKIYACYAHENYMDKKLIELKKTNISIIVFEYE